MRYYPVFVDLADQPCTVIGDGKFAAEKAAGLREAGALVRVIASGDYTPGDTNGLGVAGGWFVAIPRSGPELGMDTWNAHGDASRSSTSAPERRQPTKAR